MTRHGIALIIFLASLSSPGFGENIRGRVAAVKEIAAEPVTFSVSVNEMASLRVAEPTRFLEALRLEIRIPQESRDFAGGLALYLYKDITPAPREEVMTLSGTRVYFEGLPQASRFFLLIPMQEDHTLSGSADTVLVGSVVPPEAFPIAVALFPAMKGLPRRIHEARFPVEVRRVVSNEGALQLEIVDDSGEPVPTEVAAKREFSIRVNGSEVAHDTRELVLQPGLHEVELRSDIYENRNVTVGIERGSVSNLELELIRPRSRINIEAPDGSEVFVDGTRVNIASGAVTVEPGEHTVLFRVGDYTVSRNISVKPKKDYNISLSLNILVHEE